MKISNKKNLVFDISEHFPNREVNEEILIENCLIDSLMIGYSKIYQSVSIINCVFLSNDVTITNRNYDGGLLISSCIFASLENDGEISFDSIYARNGHIKFQGNVFHSFVDFSDCYFYAPLTVSENIFMRGSNLLGEGQLSPVIGEVSTISDNIGKIDLSHGFL